MNLKEAIEEIIKLKRENAKLRKKCEELAKRLKVYENPHTPSSKRVIKVKKTPKTRKKPKKRGAPKGHKGATRKTPTPDKTIELKPKYCPKCKGTKIKTKKRKKVVEDVEIVKVVTEYHYYECVCEKCNKKFTTRDENLPEDGIFGPNILTLWSMLHYYGTVPFDRLSKISKNCFDMDISAGGIHNVIYRTVSIFESRFNRIRNRIAKSSQVGSDETKYSFNGKRYWLWSFTTPKDTLFLIRKSRGSVVLKETFGKFLDAVLSSDCFSAYQKFKAREYQKCWSHILRDAEDLAKHNKKGQELHNALSRMFKYIEKIKRNNQENTPKTKLWRWRQKKKILSWLEEDYESKAVLNLVLRISKYIDDWFTCLKYPEVEPTNNATERAIRKAVIARKVSGLHRSELGKHSREIMMSIILTLEKRKENVFEFVNNGIRRRNLGLRVS